jgi:hypothetical protein
MTTVLQILTKARDLIEKKGWTQNSNARNKNGKEVLEHNRNAVCFCASGAIWRAGGRCWNQEIDDAEEILISCIRNQEIVEWNDQEGRTKKQVLAAFDRAIAKAKLNPRD